MTPLPAESLRRIAELLHDLVPELDAIRHRADVAIDRVAEGSMPDAEVREIRRGAEDTAAILRDTLNLITGWSRGAEQQFHPGEAVEAMLGAMTASLARVELSVHIAVAADASIAGARSWYRRATANLLRNALSHAQRRVALTVREQADRDGRAGYVVEIEDDGAGWGRTQRPAGYRIGLESVRWAASLLGGELEVDASPQLGGARAALWFPAVTHSAAAPSARPMLEGVHVAAIDDHDAIRNLIVRALRGVGARVSAYGPDVPLEELLAGAPDVLLLDLNLGVTTGEELWLRLRRLNPVLAARTIFLTGGLTEELATAAAQQPMMAKPFGVVELATGIRELLERADRAPTVIGLVGLDTDSHEIYSAVLRQHEIPVRAISMDAEPGELIELDRLGAVIVCADWNAERAVEFIERLRRHPLGAQCPAVLITPDPYSRHLDALRDRNAVEVLVAPVSPHDILRRALLGFGAAARGAF